MGPRHPKRDYWGRAGPPEEDIYDIIGLDGESYTFYVPSRSGDVDQFYDEFDRIAGEQLGRAKHQLGYRPSPDEVVELRKESGEKAKLVDEQDGWGFFHVGGRCAELLGSATCRMDDRFEPQAIGIGTHEGVIFLGRPVSKDTQKACREKRARDDSRNRGKGGRGDSDGGHKDRGAKDPPKGSAYRTVNPGHWAASERGPWGFRGAEKAGGDRP